MGKNRQTNESIIEIRSIVNKYNERDNYIDHTKDRAFTRD